MPEKRIRKLILIFNADAGKLNALLDSAKKLLGTSDCPLCEITHGLAGEKGEWTQCRQELGIPVEYVHRDEVADELNELAAGRLPAVVAVTDAGGELLLPREVLERCRGSVNDFKGRILTRAAMRGLVIAA